MLNYTDQLATILPCGLEGSVVRVVGMAAAVADLPAPLGALVEIDVQRGEPLEAEVIGFDGGATLVYPFASLAGVRRGHRVRLRRTSNRMGVGHELLSRIVDARGRAIDGRPPPVTTERIALDGPPPRPVERPRIDTPLTTGIRAIDGLLTCGKGQRMGIFSGSGVGKSVTLGIMSRHSSADVNVIALIGERGREVNEFIERDLGPEGLAKSVLVVATSDEPALLRVRAAFAATAIAEFFRDQGNDVLLVMDSITRFALAQREIGLTAGEPPTTRGFPPSVFALLPKLVERAGRGPRGSITAFYSVLVEADDANEPIADALRGLLDGHTWLSRKLATKGHYPPIDVLESTSRLMSDVTTPQHREAAAVVLELLAAHRDHEDLISIGAYRRGANRVVDLAIEMLDPIHEFLRQRVDQHGSIESARESLIRLRARCDERPTVTPENAT
ncbi:MAG TPA: FliI/YscN family ATPase [Pirellulales bacterium]|nr:FliI/YscN family ATPase [Pirellulales bacterium]